MQPTESRGTKHPTNNLQLLNTVSSGQAWPPVLALASYERPTRLVTVALWGLGPRFSLWRPTNAHKLCCSSSQTLILPVHNPIHSPTQHANDRLKSNNGLHDNPASPMSAMPLSAFASIDPRRRPAIDPHAQIQYANCTNNCHDPSFSPTTNLHWYRCTQAPQTTSVHVLLPCAPEAARPPAR